MDMLGNFTSEFEAAYDLSRREATYPRQQGLVDQQVAAGKHVLVLRAAQYCRFTDAIIGDSVEVVSVHDTREEAVVALQAVQPGTDEFQPDDFFYSVSSPRPPAAVVAIDSYAYGADDIPF